MPSRTEQMQEDVSAIAPELVARIREREGDLERLKLEALQLPCRLWSCLVRAGYATVGDLAVTSEAELLRVRNFGVKSLAELRAAVQALAEADTNRVLARNAEMARLAAGHAPAEADANPLFEPRDIKEAVQALLAALTSRERQVVEMRYGLSGSVPQRLEAIGRVLGVTRERIRQIVAEAMNHAKMKRRRESRYALFTGPILRVVAEQVAAMGGICTPSELADRLRRSEKLGLMSAEGLVEFALNLGSSDVSRLSVDGKKLITTVPGEQIQRLDAAARAVMAGTSQDKMEARAICRAILKRESGVDKRLVQALVRARYGAPS